MDSATANMCHLHFSYWPINIKRPMRMYSDIQYQRLQNLVWMFVQQLFMLTETAIHNAVKTGWPNCEVKACRFHLGQSWWRKIKSLGLSKQYWKKDWGKSVLEENIWTVAFTTSGRQWLPDDKRMEQFFDYLLESDIDADSTFSPCVWS